MVYSGKRYGSDEILLVSDGIVVGRDEIDDWVCGGCSGVVSTEVGVMVAECLGQCSLFTFCLLGTHSDEMARASRCRRPLITRHGRNTNPKKNI